MAEAAATFDENQLARGLREARGLSSALPQSQANPLQSVSDTLEDEQVQQAGSQIASMLLKGNLVAAAGKLQEAAVTVSQTFAQKISAQVSYSIWKAAILNVPDTIGLSLFALVIIDIHYITKKAGIPPFAKLLCEPGEDGMVGMLPPMKVSLGVVKMAYKWINIIALICVNCLLLLVSVLAFSLFFLPPILAIGTIYSISQFDFGQLSETIKIIFQLI